MYAPKLQTKRQLSCLIFFHGYRARILALEQKTFLFFCPIFKSGRRAKMGLKGCKNIYPDIKNRNIYSLAVTILFMVGFG